MIELMNMMSGLSTTRLDTMIGKFTAYSILLRIPAIYSAQKKAFNVKFDVQDFFLTIKEEEEDLSVGRGTTLQSRVTGASTIN